MLTDDLRELLLSIAEEDAIISNLYSFFIVNKGYSIKIMEQIIFYGMSIGWFEIVDVSSGIKVNTEIDWGLDNNNQEILFSDMSVAVDKLFNAPYKIPIPFQKFLVTENDL